MTSAKNSNPCKSGRGDCLNPESSERPTDLNTESKESQEAGYCNYCRRAGIGAKDAFFSFSSGISIQPPDEDDFNDEDFPSTFNQSAYDNFDPDAYDPDKIVSADPAIRNSNISSESLDDLDEEVDYEDQKEYFDLSELVANEKMKAFEIKAPSAPEKPQEPEDSKKETRGRPKKAVLELVEDDKPKKKRGRPSKQIEEIDLSEPKRLRSFKEAFADKLEEEDILVSIPLPSAPRKEVSTAATAPSPKKENADAGEESAWEEKLKPSALFSKMPPKPTEVILDSVFAKNDASSSATNASNPIGVSRVSILSRLLLGFKEFGFGLMDIATSSGRMVASLCSVPLVILFTFMQLPIHVIKLSPVKFIKALYDGLKKSLSLIVFAFKPMFDGRLIPSLGFIIASAGLALSPFTSEAISIILLASGCGTALGWAVWRAARGIITGSSLEKIVKKWERDWLNTENMSSKQVHKLNNEFEEVVADVFEEMGFRVKLNGTQAARENGHVGSGDGGADVFLYDSHRRMSVVSCKRYTSPVGVKEVRDIFAVSQGADFKGSRPVLVTTIGFSQPAIDFAKKNGVLLLKYTDIMNQAKRFSS